jgi:hypothetical protein
MSLLPLQPPGTRLVLGYRRGRPARRVKAHWRRGVSKRDPNPITRYLRWTGEMDEIERQGWLLGSAAIMKKFSQDDASCRLYAQLLIQNQVWYTALVEELPSLTKGIENYNPRKRT